MHFDALHEEPQIGFAELDIAAAEPIPDHLDLDVDENGAFLVLEWLPFNLADWIEKHGPMHWDEYFFQIGRPILDAIVFAQSRSWSHRDIKPTNILLTNDGIGLPPRRLLQTCTSIEQPPLQ
jgi:serine/threonine protein kinase